MWENLKENELFEIQFYSGIWHNSCYKYTKTPIKYKDILQVFTEMLNDNDNEQVTEIRIVKTPTKFKPHKFTKLD